jgi:hypothetical protein
MTFMLKINKKILIVLTILLSFSFIYGFISHRNKIFPYQIIKNITEIFGVTKPRNTKEHIFLRNKYKNWNDININFKPIKENFFKTYHPGINFFSDRHYFNHVGDEHLIDFSIIQLLKHQSTNIELMTSDEIEVYRALCEHNNNNGYKNWEKVNFKILIISHTCVFKDLVKKKFKKGKIVLNPGGPKSSDPILIFSQKKNIKIEIFNRPAEQFLVPAYKLLN